MTDSLQAAILVLLRIVGAFICGLILLIWYGIRAWLKDRREREEKLEQRDKELTNSIDGLKESIWSLRDLYVLRRDYDRDMAMLGFAPRRASDPPTPTGAPSQNLLHPGRQA